MSLLPNIIITGTPGTGKTSLSSRLSKELGFIHLNVSEIIKVWLGLLYRGWILILINDSYNDSTLVLLH